MESADGGGGVGRADEVQLGHGRVAVEEGLTQQEQHSTEIYHEPCREMEWNRTSDKNRMETEQMGTKLILMKYSSVCANVTKKSQSASHWCKKKLCNSKNYAKGSYHLSMLLSVAPS